MILRLKLREKSIYRHTEMSLCVICEMKVFFFFGVKLGSRVNTDLGLTLIVLRISLAVHVH